MAKFVQIKMLKSLSGLERHVVGDTGLHPGVNAPGERGKAWSQESGTPDKGVGHLVYLPKTAYG
jgi:hypothetical protein